MANTTNYNWETPDDTDLVKDGAAAIRTLGNSIDTTTKNLNPETTTGDIAYRSATANTNTRLAIGTTGQVLTVAAGVPSWATPNVGDITAVTAGTGLSGGGTSGDVSLAIDSTVATLTGTQTLTNKTLTSPVLTTPTISTIDAKGDLLAGTADNTIARLAVGANGTVLTADSAEATGLKWATSASASGPAFKARRTADQNVPTANTWVKVQFNAEVYDTDNCFDSTTNYRFTPTKAGYYQFNTKLYFPINSNFVNFCAIYKNGTVIAQSNGGTNGTNANMAGPPGISDLQSANGTTDYFEVYAYSTSSGNDIGGGAEQVTYFSGVWIRGL